MREPVKVVKGKVCKGALKEFGRMSFLQTLGIARPLPRSAQDTHDMNRMTYRNMVDHAQDTEHFTIRDRLKRKCSRCLELCQARLPLLGCQTAMAFVVPLPQLRQQAMTAAAQGAAPADHCHGPPHAQASWPGTSPRTLALHAVGAHPLDCRRMQSYGDLPCML
jgi:hypothetical protein